MRSIEVEVIVCLDSEIVEAFSSLVIRMVRCRQVVVSKTEAATRESRYVSSESIVEVPIKEGTQRD